MAQSFSLSGAVQLNPSWTDGSATDDVAVNVALSLDNGTGVGQANSFWSNTYSVAAGQSASIDLTALAKAAFGASGSINIWKVKALLLRNLSSVTTFTVGGTPTDRWGGFSSSGTLVIAPDGLVLATAPIGGLATSGTSKALDVVNTDQVYSLTGNTTTGQASVTGISSTAGLAAGMTVAGTGIPAAAKIATVTSGTAITLTAAATATTTGVALTIEQPAASLQVVVAGVLD